MADHHDVETAKAGLEPITIERLARPFQRFARLSSAGGLVLLAATVAALIWANSEAGHTYDRIFHGTSLSVVVEDAPHEQHQAAEGHAEGEDHTDHAPATDHDAAPGQGGAGDGHEPARAEPDEATHTQPTDEDHHQPEAHINLNFHLVHWINDALMAVFFLLVGLEIKREILVGELASPRRAALPIVAAIGGMIVPAVIYTAFNFSDSHGSRGWGIPMATDIAFALGILALLGSRVPNSLRVFLTSLAIVDDLGALVVIAIFYTDKLDTSALMYAGLVLGFLYMLNLLGVRSILAYLIPGIVLWYFVLISGVHATIAGVLLASAIPASSRVNSERYLRFTRAALKVFERAADPGRRVNSNSMQRAAVIAIEENNRLILPPLHRIEHGLNPWVAFLIIPIFALANAGVVVPDGGLLEAVRGNVSVGVILGLFIGKPIGVVLASFLAVKTGLAKLPAGVTKRHIIGAGCLAGIGFTMAIFIANLAFKPSADASQAELVEAATNLQHAIIGILLASAASSVVGLLILATSPRKPEPEPEELGPEIHV